MGRVRHSAKLRRYAPHLIEDTVAQLFFAPLLGLGNRPCHMAVVAQVTGWRYHLRWALGTLIGRGKSAIEKIRRLQEARRATLLASSLDAIAVTNIDRRFVAANPKALHLFGVSEAHIRQFTIDGFLLAKMSYFDGNGLPFVSREEQQGECQIRRLDGSLRLTAFIFVANFVPFWHLFRFCNVRECAPKTELPPDKRDTGLRATQKWNLASFFGASREVSDDAATPGQVPRGCQELRFLLSYEGKVCALIRAIVFPSPILELL